MKKMHWKWVLLAIAVLGIIAFGYFAFNSYIYNEKQTSPAADYKDAEYVIDGQRVKLNNGVAETGAAPGSTSKVVTRYFGNEVEVDLNDDGRDDVVFILTQQPGGSGTFFYVVAALNTETGYVGSEGYLLGERIAPQSTELSQNPSHQNVVVVNYMDRASGEPMTATPSIGKSVWLKLDPQAMQFGVVEQNFAGEADPSRLSLTMKDWMWVSAQYNDGRSVKPDQIGSFVLSFEEEGRFSATTDCNSMSGTYVADAEAVSFSSIAMTEMFCEGSQESEFLKLLENTQMYHFTSRGELILDLQFDSGSAVFK